MEGQIDSPLLLLLGELVDRSGHGSAGVVSSWLVCPSAPGLRRCCFGLLAQTVAVSLVGSSSFAVSFGRLVASRVVCLDGRQGNGSLKNPYRLGVDFPSFRHTPLGDSASLYTPLGGGADPHYHIVRPK